MRRQFIRTSCAAGLLSLCVTGLAAGQAPPAPGSAGPVSGPSAVALTAAPAPAPAAPASAAAPATVRAPAAVAPAVVAPTDYIIGPNDVLSVVFWRDKDMSGDVTVRPDGRISLPLVNDVLAAGLTPEQLRVNLIAAYTKFDQDPTITVTLKQLNSRKVFVTGQVSKPGSYDLTGPLDVLQLIAMAGGLNEYADKENVAVIRTENGQPKRYRINYKDVTKGKNLKQNITLKAGDTVIVP